METPPERIKKAIKEMRAVCAKYGVFLVGGCEREGIYGEIGIGLVEDPESCGFIKPHMQSEKLRFFPDFWQVERIGDTKPTSRSAEPSSGTAQE